MLLFKWIGDILKCYVIARNVVSRSPERSEGDEAIPVVYEIATPFSGRARNDRRGSNDHKEDYVSLII